MNNRQLPHVWYNQEKQSGSASNMFFIGNVIYSYGTHFPIAVIKNGLVLFTTNSYSVSTSKHISLVHGAIPSGTKIIYCKYPTEAASNSHSRNIESFKSALENVKKDLERARKKDKHIYKLNMLNYNIHSYFKHFNLNINDL